MNASTSPPITWQFDVGDEVERLDTHARGTIVAQYATIREPNRVERLGQTVAYDGEIRDLVYRIHLAGSGACVARQSNLKRWTPDQTNPVEYVDTAMHSRVKDIGTLIKLAERRPVDHDEVGGLGLGIDLEPGITAEEVEEAATEALYAYPLAVEATVTFEVVIGTGGPDDRLLFECDVELLDPSEFGRFPDSDGYTIRRVSYRYSWEGTAEVELHGEARDTAIAFARRVVPELADA